MSLSAGVLLAWDSRPIIPSVRGDKKHLQPPGWRATNILNKSTISRKIVLNLQPPDFSGGFLWLLNTKGKRMRRSFITFFIMFSFVAYADKTITSKKYVDTEVAKKQDKVPAINTNTVLTHTDTQGVIETKGIYQETGTYDEQINNLVTVGTVDAGIQNALETEFICEESDEEGCLIWRIHNKTTQQIIPDGYTRLEYVSINTEGPCILTNVSWGSVYGFRGRAQQTVYSGMNRIIFGSDSNDLNTFYGTLQRGDNQRYWYNVSEVPSSSVGEFNFTRIDETGYWRGTVNNINSERVTSNATSNDKVRLLCGASSASDRRFVGNVWYLQLMDENGVFLLNAIPVKRDSDGLVGFYDLVSNQILTNSGNGTFNAGPETTSNIYIPSGQ